MSSSDPLTNFDIPVTGTSIDSNLKTTKASRKRGRGLLHGSHNESHIEKNKVLCDGNNQPVNIHKNVPNNEYTSNNKGPCFLTTQFSQETIHPLSVGSILHRTFPNMIKNIHKDSKNSVSAECKSGPDANKIVLNNHVIGKSKLKAFIPNYRVAWKGIIRKLHSVISSEEIKDFTLTKSGCWILETLRFTQGMDDHIRDLSTVLIDFEGQGVSGYVYIFQVPVKVHLHITPVKMYYSCSRYGHVASECKNPNCLHCGDKPPDTNVSGPKQTDPPVLFSIYSPPPPETPSFNAFSPQFARIKNNPCSPPSWNKECDRIVWIRLANQKKDLVTSS